jgi:L,D-peptidoglycan transpeptidase YkuD (ErfK/YbiS/YcfS/YnhG family)
VRAKEGKPSRLVTTLVVRRRGGKTVLGHVQIHPTINLPCVLGASGISRLKREGDKATPAGAMRVIRGYYRPDRMPRPACRVPLQPLHRALGWCDDPGSPLYNRAAPLPMGAGHETMWRKDGLYDVVFVLDYNIAPRRKGAGSAIFLHCAKPTLTPTLGCVALRPADMRRLLPRLARAVKVVVL